MYLTFQVFMFRARVRPDLLRKFHIFIFAPKVLRVHFFENEVLVNNRAIDAIFLLSGFFTAPRPT